GALPKAKTTHEVDAFIDQKAHVTVNGGALTLDSRSTNTAEANPRGIEAGYLDVSVFFPQADAGGATRAYVGEGADISAVGLGMSADATNTAEANPTIISAGGLKVDVGSPKAQTTHTTETFIGPPAGAGSTPGASGMIATSGGPVTGTATSRNTATITSFSLEAAFADVDIQIHPEARTEGATRTYVGGNFTI